MRFVVIGITDNPKPFFQPEVLDVIRHGRVFSGGKRHHELVASLLPEDAQWIDITVPLDNVFEQYRAISKQVIIFASGDPLFFGFANTIRREMPDAEITVYPSFNSLQLLAHRLVMPYHDMRIVSLTGRPWPEFDRALIERTPKIGILTDREHTPAAIARRMLDYGYTYYNIYVGEHLGNPEQERISRMTLNEAAEREFSMPNCVIISRYEVQGTRYENRPASKTDLAPRTSHLVPRYYGIPDAAFTLLDGREKMITKMPIRLLSLQALDLPRRHVLWDIGFCTGSISIEARLLFPHLQIEAFEIRPECEAIIRENARRFGAPGINVHIGDFMAYDLAPRTTLGTDGHGCTRISNLVPRTSYLAPRTHTPHPEPLISPDAVFIGGHGGRLKEMMAKVKDYLAPGGIIVMNSVKAPKVTTDSHRLWDEACAELGLLQEPPLHIQLNDHHPITILKCRKE